MTDIIPFLSANDVRKKYPIKWDITTAKWGQVVKRTTGPFIATILNLHGQAIRWRVKKLVVYADGNDGFVKDYQVCGAGRSATILSAKNHIEETVLPRLLSWYERDQLRKEVANNVG
jgi:hypothetical protein